VLRRSCSFAEESPDEAFALRRQRKEGCCVRDVLPVLAHLGCAPAAAPAKRVAILVILVTTLVSPLAPAAPRAILAAALAAALLAAAFATALRLKLRPPFGYALASDAAMEEDASASAWCGCVPNPQAAEVSHYVKLLALSEDAMFSVLSMENDGACTVCYVSPGVTRLLGYTPEEYLALGCARSQHSAPPAQRASRAQSAFARKAHASGAVRAFSCARACRAQQRAA
jgi:hypothetical protein